MDWTNTAPFAAELSAYISVDIETAGPLPRVHPMLSIGACTLTEPRRSFYVELQPLGEQVDEQALSISGLSLDRLAREGESPQRAMQLFADWVTESVPAQLSPIFVAFNAPFDWSFINDAFHTHLGRNPFGHSALDVKAFAFGLLGSRWKDTSWNKLSRRYLGERSLAHHALKDAQDQADLFLMLLQQSAERLSI